ncbi:hypothetical protein BJY01DRAFT_238674 [Aspergillus pseudoustus]|uniref:Zn(2)-C6 fungal-type domain-containing protein n=1 Tax=Aspergillus pseudoustus TaxID=1810923 RepID=A0ABR4J9G4_9EURO
MGNILYPSSPSVPLFSSLAGTRQKRRRTGCTRCRASHHKCDEKRPHCGRCQRLDLECVFSDFIVPSNWCSVPTLASQPDNDEPGSGPVSSWDVFNNAAFLLPQTLSPGHCQPEGQAYPALDAEKVTLLKEYQRGVATWIDLFDNECHFECTVVKRALASPLLLSAICALTARHMSMIAKSQAWNAVAARLYGDSLVHLIASWGNTASCSEQLLPATILLSNYEVLVLPGVDHRRHVSGALTLIRTHNCRPSSGGPMAAAFWICVSGRKENQEDRLGNKIVWLLAGVIKHTFQDTHGIGRSVLQGARAGLLQELDSWFESLPESFHGTPFSPPMEEGVLPLWFPVSSNAAAICLYHLAYLLLLAEGCNCSLVTDNLQDPINDRARAIAGIAFSPISDSALIQTVQSLYFETYRITPAKHTEFIVQKVKIWGLLESIESRTGFQTNDRVKQLTRAFTFN